VFIQGSKLTFSFGSQLAINGKNTILYVPLHARKVTIEERKQLATARVTLSYKATVVLR